MRKPTPQAAGIDVPLSGRAVVRDEALLLVLLVMDRRAARRRPALGGASIRRTIGETTRERKRLSVLEDSSE